MSIPTDCPQREKNGWTADAHVTIDLALLNFDGINFYEKWLDDVSDNQNRAAFRVSFPVRVGDTTIGSVRFGMRRCLLYQCHFITIMVTPEALKSYGPFARNIWIIWPPEKTKTALLPTALAIGCITKHKRQPIIPPLATII